MAGVALALPMSAPADDVKVERDQFRVFTHTAEPVARLTGGPAAYGCTEFVFPLAVPSKNSSVATILRCAK